MSKKSKVKKETARKERVRLQKHQDRLERHVKKSAVQIKAPVITKEMFSDDEHAFWIAHGINHILSDWKEGTWTPMFPSIYEGIKVPLETIANILIGRMSEALEGKFGAEALESPKSQVALAWAATPREIIYLFVNETQRRLKAKDPDGDFLAQSKQPHNPVVWEVLNWMVSRMHAKKKA
jgi:hypothetical protein